MTATTIPTVTTAQPTGTTTARPSLWKGGLAAGAVAAAATTAVAGAAMAAGVDFEISGEAIPLAGFAQMTLISSVVGVLIAAGLRRRSARPRSRWVAVTGALTALSLVPDLVAQTETGTKLALMTTHLVAAAIVIPALARRLPEARTA